MALRGRIFKQNSGSFVNTVAATWSVGWSGLGSPQANDVVIAHLFFGNGGSHASTTVTPPAGFTAVPTVTQSLNIDGVGTAAQGFTFIYYYIATGSESGSATFTFGSTGNGNSIQMIAYSGRNTSSPFTNVATTAAVARAGSSPTNFSQTGLTFANGDDILDVLACNFGNTSDTTKTFTPPSGYANGALGFSVNGEVMLMSCDNQNQSGSGSTGTLGGSLVLSPSGNAVAYNGYLLSLAPFPPDTPMGRCFYVHP